MAAADPQWETWSAASAPKRKSQQGERGAAAPLPDVGRLQSPNWDSVAKLSDGTSGRSPLDLARQKLDGDAAVADIAALDGSGRDIDRAAIGLSQPPQAYNRIDGPLETGPSELETLSANTAASRRSSLTQRSSTDIRSSREGVGTENSGTVSNLQTPLDWTPTLADGERLDLATANPKAMMPNRRRPVSEVDLSGLDSLTLERSLAGGLAAPSTNSVVAKPAFQQRLDRLSNSSNAQDSSVGPQTELAIERGLEFLARYQRTDGSWRLQDFDTEVLIRSDTAATGLALLAFQGAGYTHLQSKYAKQVDRAIRFLISHQRPDGDLYIPQDPASDQNAWLYSHSIAALALCEAYGMTQDVRCAGGPAGCRFYGPGSRSARGGWRYRPETGSDTGIRLVHDGLEERPVSRAVHSVSDVRNRFNILCPTLRLGRPLHISIDTTPTHQIPSSKATDCVPLP